MEGVGDSGGVAVVWVGSWHAGSRHSLFPSALFPGVLLPREKYMSDGMGCWISLSLRGLAGMLSHCSIFFSLALFPKPFPTDS